jgi:peroxiredoxin
MKLVIGSIAPDFNAMGSDSTPMHLSSALNDKNAVVLVLLRSFS